MRALRSVEISSSSVASDVKDKAVETNVKHSIDGNIKNVSIGSVLNSVETKETLERWEFKIENEVDSEGKVVEGAVKDEKKIKGEIRDVIRQITASVTFLPLLDCLCSFDILIYTHT